MNSDKKQFYPLETLAKSNSLSNNNITALTEDSQDNLRIGMQDGLNRMNLKCFAVSGYSLDPKNKENQNTNFIRSIREDRNRKIWLGTNGGGLFKLTFNNILTAISVFQKFK